MPIHRSTGVLEDVRDDIAAPTIDLRTRAQELRSRPEWRAGDTASSLVVREGDLRIVLSSLRRGARLGADLTDGPVALVMVEGTAVASRVGRTVRMKPGELAVVRPNGGWALVAEHDDALVLSIFSQAPEPADIGSDSTGPAGTGC